MHIYDRAKSRVMLQLTLDLVILYSVLVATEKGECFDTILKKCSMEKFDPFNQPFQLPIVCVSPALLVANQILCIGGLIRKFGL